MADLNVYKAKLANSIKGAITDGERLIERIGDKKNTDTLSSEYESWRRKVTLLIENALNNKSLSDSFLLKTETFNNFPTSFKEIERLNKSIKMGIGFLESLKTDVSGGIYDECLKLPENILDTGENIEESMAVLIIKKILNNFNKHIQAMYQDKVHGNGTLQQSDLDRIKIGNEYDVQRILYSLIRPIFPEVRTEVVSDAKYKSVRYDLLLDEYGIIIELKCSRGNMKEKELGEQLGSDAFHYQGDYLFLFIFDQEKIIRNIDAFKIAYKRDKKTFGKDVEAIVTQPMSY